jgi:DNA-binding response OmpR family regulator
VPYQIIVVDASPTLQKIVQGAFPETEFRLLPFGDGAEVMAAAAGIRPDAVLLSLSLEGRDGADLARFLRRQAETRRVPVFFLKSAFDTVDAARIGGIAHDGIFTKPFDSERLVADVRRAIERHTTPTTLPEEPVWVEGGTEGDVREVPERGAPVRPRAEDRSDKETPGFLRNRGVTPPHARVREWVRAEIWELERELEKRIRARIQAETRGAGRDDGDPGDG